MATTRYYGTGRRKSSVARVYLMPGTGKVTINKKDMDDYFGFDTLKVIARQPLCGFLLASVLVQQVVQRTAQFVHNRLCCRQG